MGSKRKWVYYVALSVIGVALLVLCVIKADDRETLVPFKNDIPSYESLLSQSRDPIHIAFEAQALPLMDVGVVKAYRTDFISTVIIAVDRDQVSEEIQGWNCLRNSKHTVYMRYKSRLSHIDFGYTFFSMKAGLDSEDSSYSNTIHLLRHLYKDGRLTSDNPSDAPIAILFDYQAAQMIMDGRNFEIIVPSEGTLSFPAGIMSTYTDQLPEAKPEALIKAGFRLPNGECDLSIYPDSERYAYAQIAAMNPEAATLMLRVVPSFHRQVLNARLYSPANGVENMVAYLVYIIIIVLWTAMLFTRISDKALQKRLVVISSLIFFGILIRIVRLLIPSGMMDRFFWYLYYIPLVFNPAIIFSVGLFLSNNIRSRFSRVAEKTSLLISVLLTLLVLTNDFHQMAFRFYMGTEGNTYDRYYSYGWVYYYIFIRSILLISAFVYLASRKKIDLASKRLVPLLFLFSLAVVYFVGYAVGFPIFRESEFIIVYGIISLLFLEVCFRSKLIPNNDKLGELLSNAPIDIHILSEEMHIEYITNHAAELPAEILEMTQLIKPDAKYPIGFSLPDDERSLYGVFRINGGYAIFVNHLDSVIKLRGVLAEQNEKIKVQNSILTRTHKVKSEIARLQAHQELYSRVYDVLKERVNRINRMLPALSDGNRSKEELQSQLAKIKVLVNYCKRRGHLVLLEAGEEFCETTSLALWLQESVWEANSAEVEGLVTETGKTQIHSAPAALLYDCFEAVLEAAMKYSSAVLLTHLSAINDVVVMRIVIETAPRVEASDFLIENALVDALSTRGASYDIFEQEDGLKIQFSVKRGGRKNA